MSSLKYPSSGSEESGARKVYFTYGSNMHIQQMADRCPDSRLFAVGILRSYKWEINSRGVANVIQGNREDFVEGIMFTVSPDDVRALRLHEGVDAQLYCEREFDVEVEPILDTSLEGKKSADAARILALHNSESSLTELHSSADAVVPEQTHTDSHSTTKDQMESSLEPKVDSEQVGTEEQFSRYDAPSRNTATNPSSSIL